MGWEGQPVSCFEIAESLFDAITGLLLERGTCYRVWGENKRGSSSGPAGQSDSGMYVRTIDCEYVVERLRLEIQRNVQVRVGFCSVGKRVKFLAIHLLESHIFHPDAIGTLIQKRPGRAQNAAQQTLAQGGLFCAQKLA